MKRPTITKAGSASPVLKVLLHGPSGAGKTRFAATFPAPLVLDVEDGTLSARDLGVQAVPLSEFQNAGVFAPQKFVDVLNWAASKEAAEFQTIVVDSLTELQEQFIAATMPRVPDPRQAYGQWATFVRGVIQTLRNSGKHFVVVARSRMGENIEGEGTLVYPQISPAAWTHVPALVDLGFYMQQRTKGLGNAARVLPVLYTRSANAWTKTRTLMQTEYPEPTFETVLAGVLTPVQDGSAAA